MVRPILLAAAASLPALAACGGDGSGDELPASFSISATREAGVTMPCMPSSSSLDAEITGADTDAPTLLASGLTVIPPCQFGSAESGWEIICSSTLARHREATVSIHETIDGGRVTWKEYNFDGTMITCDDAWMITSIVAQ